MPDPCLQTCLSKMISNCGQVPERTFSAEGRRHLQRLEKRFADQLLGMLAGRWEVRIGLRGSKHVYLGLHSSEVEAARVYDRALVLLTGQTAATNFPVSNYKNQMDAYDQ